jgi:hypothetical protein
MSVFTKLRTASPRRWRRIAAVVGMSLALVVATGAPAYAGNATLTDDFEAADANSVWAEAQFHCCDVGDHPPGYSHSASHSGYLGPTWSLQSWTGLGRSVHLPTMVGTPGSNKCKASIWVYAPWNATSVNVEVINPTDWTYISVKTVALARDSGWQQIAVPIWTAYTLDVYFRVSNIGGSGSGNDVFIDDLHVICVWLS